MNHTALRLAGLGVICAAAACPRPYTPPQTPDADDYRVYVALVDAGCMARDEGGAMALDEAHANAAQPSWMNCLYDGGTVQSCDVPCGGGE